MRCFPRFRQLLAVTYSLLQAACATEATNAPLTPATGEKPVLSILANPRPIPTPVAADYAAAVDSIVAVGARGTVLTYSWRDLEPDSARLNVQQLISDVRYARGRGLQVFVGLQPINTVKREMPPDIAALPWTDARLQRRFERLLDAIAPVVNDITYLSIGNEVGDYLGAAGEWASYTSFVAREVTSLHRRSTAIKVGATIEFDAAKAQSAQATALFAVGDVAIYTHYPFASGYTVDVPTSTRTTFDRMITIAGGKPVVLQELGYPASPLNGSSDSMQAAFYTDAIAQWKLRGSVRMPFVNLFLLHDFTPQQCADFVTYYNQPNQPAFVGFLCTLGLRKADGTARPAWEAVRTAAAWLRAP